MEDAMNFNKLITALCAFLMILGVVVTQANATRWDLNKSNRDLGISGNFAFVDISVIDHTATFTIDANQALLGGGNNFGIQRFLFNTKLSGITAGDFSAVSGWQVNHNGGNGGFGSFELNYTGNGHHRMDPLTFTITDNSISSPLDFFDENIGGFHFAAHIAGFDLDLEENCHSHHSPTSAWFADGTQNTPVPEPGTILLLGAGLFGLGLFGRKRMKG
jgi:hypothetical protein